MRGNATSFVLNSGVCGALPLMAHPQRYTWEMQQAERWRKEKG